MQMEYQRDPVTLEQYKDYNFDRVPAENYRHKWPESPPYWAPPRVAYWDDRRCESPDYGIGSPKTPPIGKYITIQPRSIDTNARDERLLLPLTKKRKGNNRYGQSGSHRCQRCQKGKRKCVYSTKNEPCQRCVERGFPDCGDKLPTPRKQAALRQLQESGYLLRSDSDDYPSRQSSSDEFPSRQSTDDYPLLPMLNIDSPREWTRGNPEDEALYKLWKHLVI